MKPSTLRSLMISLVALTSIYWLLQSLLESFYYGPGLPFFNDLIMARKAEHDLRYYQAQITAFFCLAIAMVTSWPFVRNRMQLKPQAAGMVLFLYLIFWDALLLVLHMRFPAGSLFDMGRDWGIAEVYDYFKEAYAAWMLMSWCRRAKDRSYGVLAWLMLLLLLDDSLMYHEKTGALLASRLDLSSMAAWLGCDVQKVGEIASLMPYLVIFIPLGWVYLRRLPGSIVLFFAGIFLCGVVINFLESMTHFEPIKETINVIENTGTAVVLSGFAAYLWSISKQDAHSRSG